MSLLDAHNHLHDPRLAPHRPAIFGELARLGVSRAVANGTQESDWAALATLAQEVPWVLPSYGLHPWYVSRRTGPWLEALRARLETDPRAGVGEIGLDRWIEGHDLADQTVVFRAQLDLAAALNRPATIHCLRAWGALWEVVKSNALPARGFLLHAYGGPAEMVPGFVARGGYFSFNAYFLHDRKSAQREVFRHLPADRLLVETDAPDLRPPDTHNAYPLRDAAGESINHPANLAVAYAALAELRGVPEDQLGRQIAENFARLFGT